MPFPIFKRGGIVGVRVAIVTKMRAGVVFADILRHNTTACLALTFIFMLRVNIISDNPAREVFLTQEVALGDVL